MTRSGVKLIINLCRSCIGEGRYRAARVLITGLLVLFCRTNLLLAQYATPSTLDPKTYLSRSGEFALEVDPSAMNGQGEGSYRLTKKGKPVWAAKHPFTLWEAIVTDDGSVAG